MTARPLAAAVLAVALLAATVTGCAQSVDPIERLGRKAAHAARQAARTSSPDGHAHAYRRWGLSSPVPLAPPPAPRPRIRAAGPGLPPVVDRVPTHDKVVFLTYDDGAERDPRFVDLVRELRLPVSMFLTDSVVGPGYAHFARLREVGANVQNHTLDHQSLQGLPYAGQRAEICGQQDKLRERFGLRPRLFRPPYGTYDTTTLRAAGDCGVSAVVLWTEGERLQAGDILLVGPDDDLDGPPLVERTVRLLREVQERGLSVGRLEDYL
ncbi:polysaccharide deacetylase family protein [Streptomyces sp. SID12501]|uniref:Polysaccharide deacetylase family protein n=1 Tax=Streptomyces sp. SID12501 TaxID=2706042 RepID=A0A6B3C2A8_9ACTN|nr:polysaccharide deacetylase family protein [Streptomyces sp. SID12501]NEC90897.1 polysaccharide deacetylase family protein [Streptomyces sp. SID12501]